MDDNAMFSEILSTGRLRVALAGAELPPVPEATHRELLALDRRARLEMAFEPPALLVPAATWAATTFYHAAVIFAERSLDAAAVEKALTVPVPADPLQTPAVHYSVDLSFQFLPDLLRLARGLSPEDPLVAALVRLARAWPLSSIGVVEIDRAEDLAIDPILDDRSLRALYVQRVIERRAIARLSHPQVREAVAAAIGLHPSLAPDIAKELANTGA